MSDSEIVNGRANLFEVVSFQECPAGANRQPNDPTEGHSGTGPQSQVHSANNALDGLLQLLNQTV